MLPQWGAGMFLTLMAGVCAVANVRIWMARYKMRGAGRRNGILSDRQEGMWVSLDVVMGYIKAIAI